jgi:hypothetical protein
MEKTLEKAVKQKNINSKAHNDVIAGREPTSEDSFYISCYTYWSSLMTWFYSLEFKGQM